VANRYQYLIDQQNGKQTESPRIKNRYQSLIDEQNKELEDLNSSIPSILIKRFARDNQTLSSGPRIGLTPSSQQNNNNATTSNPVVGENLFVSNAFPIHQNDNPILKGIKGFGNAAFSIPSSVGEVLRRTAIQGGSLLSGNGLKELPKNTSFTQDILPESASNALNSFQQNHPIAGGLANMAIEGAVDPTMYIGGGTIKSLMTPKAEFSMAKLNLTPMEKANNNLTPISQYAKRKTGFGPLSQSNDVQDAIAEVNARMDNHINDIVQTLKQSEADVKLDTIRKKIFDMGGIKSGNGDIFEEQRIIPNWIRNNKTGQEIDKVADEIGMTTGDLLETINSEKFKPKDYISEAYRVAQKDPTYIELSKTLEALKTELPETKTLSEIASAKDSPFVKSSPIPTKDTKVFWESVGKELSSKGIQHPTNVELFKKEITEGKIDISKLSNEMEIRKMLGMDLQKFGENEVPEMSIKGTIPPGKKESGVSRNLSTDTARPTEMQDKYWEEPLSYTPVSNPESLAKAQAIFDEGLEPAIAKLSKLHEDLSSEAPPLMKLIADKLYKDGNAARADELIAEAASRATQAGRYGQAYRILRNAQDSTAFDLTMRKQLNKLNEEGLKAYGKKWKDVDLTPEEVSAIGKIKPGDQKTFESVFEQIQKRIANEMPSSAFEKINAWRHISMLMNPKTHIRNVLGNGIMLTMRKSAQRVSGMLQKVLPKEERTQAVFVDKEYKTLAKAYFEANKKELLSGVNKYQEGITLNMPDKRVFRKSRIGEKLGKDIDVLEKVRKFNYELLQKGDNPFFQKAYIDRLASYAQAKGTKDLSKLGQEAFETARLEAEQATYKDASVIADFLNKVKHPEKSASLGRKTGAVLTEAALPFTKTPINIIKRGIQYSPIGIVNGLAGIKSSKGAAKVIDEMAKGLTGTGVLGLGYLLASSGILTGKASKDADLKAYDTNTGNSPFSVLGKYSYDWAQPFSIPLAVGVEIYNAIKDDSKTLSKMDSVVANNDAPRLQQIAASFAEGIYDSLAASGDTVFNMSVMKGIKTLLANPNGITAGLLQLPQGYASQFIPTLSNQIAGTIDPLAREVYIKGNAPETFKNTLRAKIPLANMGLQPKQTPFGEDMKKVENPLGRIFSQFFSPGIISKNQNIDPKIDTELRRLNELGLTNQFPTMVPNYIEKTQSHPKIMLTPAETTQYQKRTGELTLNSFQKIIDSNSYQGARKTKLKTGDEIKADKLAEAISDAKATAKKEILKSRGLK